MQKIIMETKGLTKVFKTGRQEEVHALRGVDLAVLEGEFAAIMGSSGSGKSTLLHLLGFMDRPTGGDLLYEGRLMTDLGDGEMTRIRGSEIGFVFQTFNLIPSLNAWENVAFAAHFAGALPARQRKARATELLDLVGLGQRANHRPAELSGGQRQRVAIARALMNRPKLLLADEPTGNLDSSTGTMVVDLLQKLNDSGQTVVLVTHNPEVAARAKKVYRMKDGLMREVKSGDFFVAD